MLYHITNEFHLAPIQIQIALIVFTVGLPEAVSMFLIPKVYIPDFAKVSSMHNGRKLANRKQKTEGQ